MAIEVLIVAVVAALLAFAVATYTPRLAFGIVWGRRVVFGLFAIIGALILASTGRVRLMVIGGLALFVIALVILVDEPHEEVW